MLAKPTEDERIRFFQNYLQTAPPPSRVPANHLGKRASKNLAQQEAEDDKDQSWE